MANSDKAIGGFVSGVAQNAVASVVLFAAGAAGVAAGLSKSADFASRDNWRLWVLVVGVALSVIFGANLLRLMRRRWRRWQIRAATGERVSILIACLGGDEPHLPKRREIEAAIKRQFHDALALTSWPEELAEPDGRDVDAAVAVKRKAQRWLAQTNCDLLIWGHVKGDRAITLHFALRDAEGKSKSYALTDDTLELRSDFGEDLAAVLAARISSKLAAGGRVTLPSLQQSRTRMKQLLSGNLPAAARTSVLLSYANLLIHLAEFDPASDDYRTAAAACEAALGLMDRDLHDIDWGTAQNLLGISSTKLGERTQDNGALPNALAAYGRALEVFVRDSRPLEWAMVQNNLAITDQLLGEREGSVEVIGQAVVRYRAIMEVTTRERLPLDWARVQSNLGAALQRIGELQAGTEPFEEALRALQAALQVRTRKAMPLEWAMTQANIGSVLKDLGDRGDPSRYTESCAAFRAALEVYDREQLPFQWASAQNNLGNSLERLGRYEDATTYLEEAIACFRASLEVRTRSALPFLWAGTQNNLGCVMETLGRRTDDRFLRNEAIQAFENALQVFERAQQPIRWAMIEANRGRVLLWRAQTEPQCAHAQAALSSLSEALAALSSSGMRPLVEDVVENLGEAQALVRRLCH